MHIFSSPLQNGWLGDDPFFLGQKSMLSEAFAVSFRDPYINWCSISEVPLRSYKANDNTIHSWYTFNIHESNMSLFQLDDSKSLLI